VVHTTEVIYLWVAAVSDSDTSQVDHSIRSSITQRYRHFCRSTYE
jgi:hypothetical protein